MHCRLSPFWVATAARLSNLALNSSNKIIASFQPSLSNLIAAKRRTLSSFLGTSEHAMMMNKFKMYSSSPLHTNKTPEKPPPQSCDTFVYVSAGKGTVGPSGTLFGKNSDRPSEEAHEVVYIPPRSDHPAGSKVCCTHGIEILQASSTLGVVLSRPAWLWGCEMGANECGVVGGNEAVSTLLSSELDVPGGVDGRPHGLLGMDLLRLALERGRTAREAMEVCIDLLEKYGQGGRCSEDPDDDWTYENGFLFADASEAFVLETAGRSHWASERVAPGTCRNISNGVSIRANSMESCSSDIQQICRDRGWWDGQSPFDWKASVCFGGAPSADYRLEIRGREKAGADHLQQMSDKHSRGELRSEDAAGWIRCMANALRDEDSGICFRDTYGFCSTGSQISWIPGCANDSKDSCDATHLFTATSDPMIASYKRFVFRDVDKEEGMTNYGTLDLWHRWRKIALQGGLKRCYSRDEVNKMQKIMKETEDQAVNTITNAVFSGKTPQISFKFAVGQELSVLEKKESQQT